MPPLNPGRDVPGDSGSVQEGGDLRNRLNRRKAAALKGATSAISTKEAKAIMDRIASLEEKFSGDVTSLKKDVKSQVSHLQKNLWQVAEVVNVDITPS